MMIEIELNEREGLEFVLKGLYGAIAFTYRGYDKNVVISDFKQDMEALGLEAYDIPFNDGVECYISLRKKAS